MSLKTDIKNNIGEKPYQCNKCPKAFKQKQGLKFHERNHTGERPYGCNMCPKAFTQKHILKDHIKNHIGEKPYQCDKCPKAYIQKQGLKVHRLSHVKNKCKYPKCDQYFTDSDILQKHVRSHLESNIICDPGENKASIFSTLNKKVDATNLPRNKLMKSNCNMQYKEIFSDSLKKEEKQDLIKKEENKDLIKEEEKQQSNTEIIEPLYVVEWKDVLQTI